MTTLTGRAVYWACLIACALSIGCIAGAVPMPTRTRAATGEEIKQGVHTDFIHPGQTTRAEVTEKLAWVSAGLESDKYFWARWSKSNTATFAALCGYMNCLGAGGERHWGGITNALVEFDDTGLVKHYIVFGDQSLSKELSSGPVRESPADFSVPQQFWVDHYKLSDTHAARVILSRDTLEIQESGDKSDSFRIAAAKVLRVGPLADSHGEDPQHAHQIIYFEEKTKAGEKMSIGISPPDLVLLLKFIDQENVREPVDNR